jgi:hypothetical protein
MAVMSVREPDRIAVRHAAVQRRGLLHFALRRARLLTTPRDRGNQRDAHALLFGGHGQHGTATGPVDD